MRYSGLLACALEHAELQLLSLIALRNMCSVCGIALSISTLRHMH